MLGATALLLGLGLIMVLSASSIFARLNYDGNSFAIVERQLIFAVAGLSGAYAAAHMPLRILRKLILPFLIVSVLLIMATFIPGVGIEVNGNRNWLPLVGGFRLQPSEFAKLALVLWMADHYAKRHKQLDTPRLILLPMVPVAGFVAMLVVGQRDLGTALVLFALIIGMLWVAGLPGKQMGAMLAGLFVAAGVRGRQLTSPRRTTTQLHRSRVRSRHPRIPGHPRHDGACSRWFLGRRPRRQSAEVGLAARGAHRLHPCGDR